MQKNGVSPTVAIAAVALLLIVIGFIGWRMFAAPSGGPAPNTPPPGASSGSAPVDPSRVNGNPMGGSQNPAGSGGSQPQGSQNPGGQ